MLLKNTYRRVAAVLSLLILFTAADAQKKSKETLVAGTPVMWERVNVGSQNTYLGPGGEAMQPDLSRITFIKQETGGYSKKYRIRDGSGMVWVAKIGREAQSETAAVRLLSAIGYHTEINYLVPRLAIPGKGTFTNVRLEARPDDVKRGKEWKWGSTPFERTPQMKGLMLMMAFINNWDMKSSNNVILKKGGRDHYVISDLGVSFGKTGSNPLPLIWRFGRSRNNPGDYSKSRLVSGGKNGRVQVVFNGKNRSRMKNFTTGDARWLADLLVQLSDRQIRDMFRAANYSPRDINTLTAAVRSRIRQLDRAASDDRRIG